jgi:hypothetical protein
MRVASGFLDAQGTPRLRFELSGDSARSAEANCKLEGIIDTGFSGFISMPRATKCYCWIRNRSTRSAPWMEMASACGIA